MSQHFEINRGDLEQTRLIKRDAGELAENSVRVRLERFALTANNITYAEFGDELQYWSFFPTEDGWGRMPVWGFATIIESNHAEISIGSRYFGFWPVSETVDLLPQTNNQGFFDVSPHRRNLPAIYNSYLRSGDAATRDADSMEATFRPLFMTSYLISQQIRDEHGSAIDALIASASSKTALGTAFCLQRAGLHCAGLSSPSRLSGLSSMGLYGKLASYQCISEIENTKPTVFVDIAGNTNIRAAVHNHLRDALVQSFVVGASHNQRGRSGESLPGPKPTMFFAPSAYETVIARDGAADFHRQFGRAWSEFTAFAGDWLQPEYCENAAGFADGYHRVRAGEISTESVLIFSFQ